MFMHSFFTYDILVILLKFGKMLDRYLVDRDYCITVKKGMVSILNFLEIEDFSSSKIVVKYQGGKTILEGRDLVISRMQDEELLIVGEIKSIIV